MATATKPTNGKPTTVRLPLIPGPPLPIGAGVLCRHPDNRAPTDEQVAALMRSIETHGQLEPVLVRALPDHHPHRGRGLDGSLLRPGRGDLFQILSGETRCLALFELDRPIVCRVLPACDDATALALLAEGNAARSDLDPIQKARLIEKLCQPIAEGGGGLTREAAGRIYGLTSGSAASNVARLLALPDQVQQLVAAGSLPETFGRSLLPFVAVPGLVDWVARQVRKWDDETRPERVTFLNNVSVFANDKTRSMDDGRKGLQSWNVAHERDRLFDVDAATREQLRVVDLPLWGRAAAPRALNATLWETLQAPARKRLAAELAKKQTAKAHRAAGGDDDGPAERSAADQQRLEREQDAQLAKRIRAWRHAWLCQLVADRLGELGADHWTVTKLALWLLANHHVAGRIDCRSILADVCNAGSPADRDTVATTLTACQANPATLLATLQAALVKPPRNPDWPDWPAEFIDALAGDVGVQLASAWEQLQRGAKPSERLQTFFALHQVRQLDELGRQLGVKLDSAATKASKMKILAGVARVLPLPKSVAPLASGKRKTPKRPAKPR